MLLVIAPNVPANCLACNSPIPKPVAKSLLHSLIFLALSPKVTSTRFCTSSKSLAMSKHFAPMPLNATVVVVAATAIDFRTSVPLLAILFSPASPLLKPLLSMRVSKINEPSATMPPPFYLKH